MLLSTYEEEEYAPRAAEGAAASYIPKAVFGPDRLESAWASSHAPLYATVTSFTMPSAACGVPSSAGTVQTIT